MVKIGDFYNNNAGKYEEFENQALINHEKYPLLFAIRNRERSFVSKAVKKKVLYFATGGGNDVLHLANLGNKVVTVDFSIGMINKATKKLDDAGVKFDLVKGEKHLTKVFLDEFFSNGKQVLIINADINEVNFPENYFDHAFCYCTLPHMGKDFEPTLKKLLLSSKNGAVSVYEKENLPHLENYYNDYGLNSHIEDRTIRIEGGFAYYVIPPGEIKEVIEKYKKLEVVHVGLGNIFVWSS